MPYEDNLIFNSETSRRLQLEARVISDILPSLLIGMPLRRLHVRVHMACRDKA